MKFFRGLIGLHDTFYQAILTRHNTFGLILDIVRETMPRDNLLNSACLELFECIRRENIKTLIVHVVEKYREKLLSIVYVDTFINLVNRYEQMQGYGADAEFTLSARGEESQAPKTQPNGQRWSGVGEMDAAEEAYFNTSDDEEDVSTLLKLYVSPYANQLQWQQTNPDTAQDRPALPPLPAAKPLVDYPDDDDEDVMDTQMDPTQSQKQEEKHVKQNICATQDPNLRHTTPPSQPPPERLSEKRRREEEDEDELVKLTSGGPKRRSSTSSNSGSAGFLRRKRSIEKGNTQSTNSVSAPPKKISINIGAKPNNTTTTTSSEKEN